MPLTEDPVAAPQIAVFGSAAGPAAGAISYDLPLPGSFTFQRIVPLGFSGEIFADNATAAGIPFTALGVVQYANGGIRQVDQERLLAYYARSVATGCQPSLRLAGAYGQDILDPTGRPADSAPVTNGGSAPLPNDIVAQTARRNSYLKAAAAAATGEVQARLSVPGA